MANILEWKQYDLCLGLSVCLCMSVYLHYRYDILLPSDGIAKTNLYKNFI